MKDSGNVPHVPFADYHFDERASLESANSHDSVGIQIADVLAGATVRYYRSLQAEPPGNSP